MRKAPRHLEFGLSVFLAALVGACLTFEYSTNPYHRQASHINHSGTCIFNKASRSSRSFKMTGEQCHRGVFTPWTSNPLPFLRAIRLDPWWIPPSRPFFNTIPHWSDTRADTPHCSGLSSSDSPWLARSSSRLHESRIVLYLRNC